MNGPPDLTAQTLQTEIGVSVVASSTEPQQVSEFQSVFMVISTCIQGVFNV